MTQEGDVMVEQQPDNQGIPWLQGEVTSYALLGTLKSLVTSPRLEEDTSLAPLAVWLGCLMMVELERVFFRWSLDNPCGVGMKHYKCMVYLKDFPV